MLAPSSKRDQDPRRWRCRRTSAGGRPAPRRRPRCVIGLVRRFGHGESSSVSPSLTHSAPSSSFGPTRSSENPTRFMSEAGVAKLAQARSGRSSIVPIPRASPVLIVRDAVRLDLLRPTGPSRRARAPWPAPASCAAFQRVWPTMMTPARSSTTMGCLKPNSRSAGCHRVNSLRQSDAGIAFIRHDGCRWGEVLRQIALSCSSLMYHHPCGKWGGQKKRTHKTNSAYRLETVSRGRLKNLRRREGTMRSVTEIRHGPLARTRTRLARGWALTA